MRSAMDSRVTKRKWNSSGEDQSELRRGPWTLEEDSLLTRYITRHGEGRWNLSAKSAGLKRTGKSCRLRWLNYLKPDIKRGEFTPQEQLLILELHSKWGNRWSRIAKHLPGRTDNQIKNFWRTRVQKQARQKNFNSDSKRFLDSVWCSWQPRLLQKLEKSSVFDVPDNDLDDSQTLSACTCSMSLANPAIDPLILSESSDPQKNKLSKQCYYSNPGNENYFTSNADNSSPGSVNSIVSSVDSSMAIQQQPENPPVVDDDGVCNSIPGENYCAQSNGYEIDNRFNPMPGFGSCDNSPSEWQMSECNWVFDDDLANDVWSMEDMWQL